MVAGGSSLQRLPPCVAPRPALAPPPSAARECAPAAPFRRRAPRQALEAALEQEPFQKFANQVLGLIVEKDK